MKELANLHLEYLKKEYPAYAEDYKFLLDLTIANFGYILWLVKIIDRKCFYEIEDDIRKSCTNTK